MGAVNSGEEAPAVFDSKILQPTVGCSQLQVTALKLTDKDDHGSKILGKQQNMVEKNHPFLLKHPHFGVQHDIIREHCSTMFKRDSCCEVELEIAALGGHIKKMCCPNQSFLLVGSAFLGSLEDPSAGWELLGSYH